MLRLCVVDCIAPLFASSAGTVVQEGSLHDELDVSRNNVGADGANPDPAPSTAWLPATRWAAAVTLRLLGFRPSNRLSRRRLPLQHIAAIVAVLCLAPATNAQTFTRIVDSLTPIPNGINNFQSLYSAPTVSGSTLTFHGQGPIPVSGPVHEGIYTTQVGGPLVLIADRSTRVPERESVFASFGQHHGSDSGVTFRGQYKLDEEWTSGYFFQPRDGGPLTTLIDRDTRIPNGAGQPSIRFYDLDNSSSTFAFNGTDEVTWGIFAGSMEGGPLMPVVLHGSPIPLGDGSFRHLTPPRVVDTTVLFSGRDDGGVDGLFAGSAAGAPVQAIVAPHSRIPGSDEDFYRIYPLGCSETTITFSGSSVDGRDGVYATAIDGSSPVVRIADRNTPIPAGAGDFSDFEGAVTSGKTVAYKGLGSDNQEGIYLATLDGGPHSKLIAVGDVLDGRTVAYVNLDPNGFDQNLLAFFAVFTDGVQSIYAAELNTPGDTNADGVVNIQDLNNVRNHFGGSGLGDTNNDGTINIVDLNAVRNNFGAGGPAAVPEPGSYTLAAIGLIAMASVIRQRKRR